MARTLSGNMSEHYLINIYRHYCRERLSYRLLTHFDQFSLCELDSVNTEMWSLFFLKMFFRRPFCRLSLPVSNQGGLHLDATSLPNTQAPLARERHGLCTGRQ